MTKELPSQELLRKLLRYDAETGKLFWRSRPMSMFSSERICKSWNSRYSGKEAFTASTYHGYRHGRINNKKYYAHRVLWMLLHGACPKGQIDHINGNRKDNRIENLRDVSGSVNQRNARMRSHNTSGHNGVSWCRWTDRWEAKIWIDGRQTRIGRFANLEAAVAARAAVEKNNGYTQRHGK